MQPKENFLDFTSVKLARGHLIINFSEQTNGKWKIEREKEDFPAKMVW